LVKGLTLALFDYGARDTKDGNDEEKDNSKLEVAQCGEDFSVCKTFDSRNHNDGGVAKIY
jgi:hypothetical protein